ncbi:MAG: hypothetical protein M1274_04405 [Actinobacteria bacterium]|nr:hypothetical protein [Actinomycetota bacterium]
MALLQESAFLSHEWYLEKVFRKSIRLGQEEEALSSGWDLYSAGQADRVWQAMLVSVSEDVGLAEPSLASNLWALYQIHRLLVDSEMAPCETVAVWTHAVLLLVHAKKSRVCAEVHLGSEAEYFSA